MQLEEWAKQDYSSVDPESDDAKKKELVELWKRSAYFYLVEGLLLNTASALSEFLDIYDSREKFISLLPDLRYIQELILSEEIGDDLLEDLTRKNLNGELKNASEKKAVRLLKRAMALLLEDRNKLFKREAAHSEAVQAVKAARAFVEQHVGDFDEKAVSTSPFAPKPQPAVSDEVWKNNRKGNVFFATHPLH